MNLKDYVLSYELKKRRVGEYKISMKRVNINEKEQGKKIAKVK